MTTRQTPDTPEPRDRITEVLGPETASPSDLGRRENEAEIREFIETLPKTELHMHLDGSLRLDTLHELLQESGGRECQQAEDAVRAAFGERVQLARCSREALERVVQIGDRARSLEQYLVPFAITLLVLQDEDKLRRVTREIVQDMAGQNCRHIELRFAPLLHRAHGLPLARIVEAVLESLKEAARQASPPMTAGLIICGMRQDVEGTIVAAELACMYKEAGVVAFDIAGPERNNPPDNHLEAFKIIQNHMLRVTVHAGEGYGPRSIRSALYDVTANRLGHGTRVYQDGDLFRYVVNTRIPLEMCLSSNVHTRTVHNYETHPLLAYLRRGVRVTLNTDNTLISNTTLNQEYEKVWRYLRATREDLKMFAINGFNSSFQDYHDANPMREEMRRVIRAL
jgi:adenosine deaminase